MTDVQDDAATTKRVPAKPFGQDRSHALMARNQALASLSRQEAFDRGYLTVKDMDDEELRYGRMRDRNGNIPPKGKNTMELIPETKYQEMIAEHERRTNERLRQNLDDMLNVMIDIAKDDTAEPRDRFEASKYLFERVAGRAPERVQHTVELKPWEGVLTDITGIGAISRAEHRRLKEQDGHAGVIDVETVPLDDAEYDVQQEDVQVPGQMATEQDVVPVHQARPDEQDTQRYAGPTVRQEPAVQQHAEPEPVYEPVQEDRAMGEEQGRSEVHPTVAVFRKHVDGSPQFDRDPAAPAADRPTVSITPDPYEQYGSRRTENKTYAEQVRAAEDLAKRRKESKDKRRAAVKARKIARATGADAIKDEITGATVGEDGRLTFE